MNTPEKTNQIKVDHLINSLNKIYPSVKELIWRSFLQGVFMGLGTTIGVSIILALLTYTISQLKLVPLLKDVINQTNVEQVLPKQ